MRKIEERMVTALRERKGMSRDNTMVAWGVTEYGGEGVQLAHVYLHGNLIATYQPDTEELYLRDAGWQTVTTKSRLNALLEGMGVRARISQRDWQWYLTTPETEYIWTGGISLFAQP